MRPIILLLTLLFSFLPVFSAVEQVSKRSEVFIPPATNAHLSSLKKAELRVFKEITYIGKEPHFGTDIRMILETKSVENIEDFSFVQFIKGCMFSSAVDSNGETIITYDSMRMNYMGNQPKLFIHKDWEVDNDSTDPVYTRNPGKGRFDLYRHSSDPNAYNLKAATWYAHSKPKKPFVYATDNPSYAYTSDDYKGGINAKNASLEFKTCLFKTADLPSTTDSSGSNIDKNKAIKCFHWDHKYIYNHELKKYMMPKSLHKACQ